MSTATDLLSTAKNNGLLLSLEGENLRVRWQGVPPSQDLLASIKTHKQELISLLAINDHYETIAQTQPLTSELLAGCEESLFNHLLDCSICHIERGEYCLQGNERGQAYDEILLQFDDQQTKRANLALHIDRNLISGRRAFVSLDHGNGSTSQQQAVKAHA